MDATQSARGSWRGYRVLIVDTDPESVNYVMRNARRYQREIESIQAVRTGADAIALAAQLQPDILLIDPDLPDMDGVRVIFTVREQGHCLILVMSRRVELDDLHRALACGANGYIVKPLDAQDWASRRSSCGCNLTEAFVFALLSPEPFEQHR